MKDLLNGLIFNDIFNDEQNGFRKGRSCADHLSSLNAIIDTRKKMRLATFSAFIDFSKAYDRINRQYLMSKLKKMELVDTC